MTGTQPTIRLILAALQTFIIASTPNGGIQAGERVAPGLHVIANATIFNIDAQRPITLSDGRWEGEPSVAGGASRPSVGLIPHFYLTGDLNGDDSEEAIVMLWQSSGGSGVFSYLAVLAWRDGEIINIGTAPVGDRVQVRSAQIADQQVIVRVIQQGSDDAACCPSHKATRYWSLLKGKLREGATEVEGLLSLADITGKEWQLVQLDRNKPLPESVYVSLRIDGDRVSGQGPCNRYFAGVATGGQVGEIKIGPAGATRMACPDPLMSLEQRYLKLLSGITRYSFMMGRLALSWQSENELGTMIFKLADKTTKGDDAGNSN